MDNLDESENNAKISDSAYSNSCSNSQSRRSRSSTHSGSHSSRSSGYGGKQSSSSSKNLSLTTEKWIKDKDGKTKKQVQNDLVQIQAKVEFRLPKPAMAYEEIKEEVSDVLPESPILDQVENGDDGNKDDTKTREDKVTSNAPESPLPIVMNKHSCSPDGFSCVLTMHDGVIYTTTSVTATLGFPKDMWIGRSFIDFIHPLDCKTFASQIVSGLATPKELNIKTVGPAGNSVTTMFCRIRKYRGLSTGFVVKNRAVPFLPFKLKLSFKFNNEEKGGVIYLVIQATPMFSAFKTTHEIIPNPVPFMTRHVSNGDIEYIDHNSVQCLGYLPQDVTGKDILQFYHPDDLAYIRQVYEIIVKQGIAPRSKPYRFMAQNGNYLKLETEWSAFINPWSRKLEFVIGKHYVVEGPSDPDVFQPPVMEVITEEAKNKAQGLKDSIVRIMKEVLTKPAELAKQQITERCQDLAAFMESLMEEPIEGGEELRLELPDNANSYYERDSVMLGGISPHHDYDSKSSSSTPLSYNQLNFNENLQRYFNSHQQMYYEEYQDTQERETPVDQQTFRGECMSPMALQSGDSSEQTSSGESSGAVVGKPVPKHYRLTESLLNRECMSPMALQSGDSSEQTSSGESSGAVVGKPVPKHYRLTESLLNRHNTEMEKWLVMQHREFRPSNKESREKSTIVKQNKKDHLARCNATYLPTLEAPTMVDPQSHGLKRSSKPPDVEWRSNKYHCSAPCFSHRHAPPAAVEPITAIPTALSQWHQGSADGMNPYTPNISVPQTVPIMSSMALPGLFPMYYVPTTAASLPSTSEMNTEMNIAPQYPMPPMQYMMYRQAMLGSSVVVSPINHNLCHPVQPLNSTLTYPSSQVSLGLTASNYEEACKPGLLLKTDNPRGIKEKKQIAESLATSSRMDRVSGNSSSICLTPDAMKRAVAHSSSSADRKMKGIRMSNSTEGVDRTDEESSYSSFYSSFFKTESSAEDSGDAKKEKSIFKRVKTDANKNAPDKVPMKREPVWMEQVCVTSELIYKYQVVTKSVTDVLSADKQKLIGFQQPCMVNDQLDQLYMDLELEGVASRLTLEEEMTSSGSSGEEAALIPNSTAKRLKKKRKYAKLVMIYEEDAPMPSPCALDEDVQAAEPEAPLA